MRANIYVCVILRPTVGGNRKKRAKTKGTADHGKRDGKSRVFTPGFHLYTKTKAGIGQQAMWQIPLHYPHGLAKSLKYGKNGIANFDILPL